MKPQDEVGENNKNHVFVKQSTDYQDTGLLNNV